MRKLSLTALLAVVFSGLFAQKLSDVQDRLAKNKPDEAKTMIDKYLADPKNQNEANAWFYKGKVYTQLGLQDTTNSLGYDALYQGFEAFKKYQQLDPKNTMMILDNNAGLFQIYETYYNRGVKSYNSKDYPNAFNTLKKGLDVEAYINQGKYTYNNISLPVLDTQLVVLTANSASLGKMEKESIPYYEKLADAKISSKEYKDVYALLAQHYILANDQQKANKYITLGKELFPDPEYWVGMEFGNPGTDTLKRFARYDEMIAKYPDNFNLNMDYASELYNYTYSNDKKPGDYMARQERLDKALKKTLALKSTAFANYVMSQHVNNQIYDLEQELRNIRGTSAADAAKRKDYIARINAKYEDLYTYSNKSYELYSQETNLKVQEKANVRRVIDQMIDYYTRKKQMDKVTFYTNKLKSL